MFAVCLEDQKLFRFNIDERICYCTDASPMVMDLSYEFRHANSDILLTMMNVLIENKGHTLARLGSCASSSPLLSGYPLTDDMY
ncbi:hypothetical protein KIN20_031771 [Parelaphostrongylus tenuis]|uniref:Uncharacterized protein n=1 Tax=Parelaphostrongylus tenuis TaxID=148309 RepID=A0AAD5WHI5_PARTN|nr:hypothetical protein KIN20_031771 [Parelaphostrongylus tenuis]